MVKKANREKPDLKDKRGLMARKENLVHLAREDLLERLVNLDREDLWVHRDHRVPKDPVES